MTPQTVDLAALRAMLINDLRQGNLRKDGSSFAVVEGTVKFLLKLVAHGKFSTFTELIDLVRSEGNLLAKADCTEFGVQNMVLRVLRLIREERANIISGDTAPDPYDSLHKFWEGSAGCERKQPSARQLRAAVVELTRELLVELETSRANIAAQAADHVRDGHTLVTFGHSRTVQAFLTAAARKRSFKVVVAENAPSMSGVELVGRLEAQWAKDCRRVSARAVSDAALFSVMSAASSVVLGAFAVLADGGMLAPAGTYALCLAAHNFSVPVIVCAGFYKLTPRFLSPEDQEGFNRISAPNQLIPFSDGDLVQQAEIYNPQFDYIPPELISLYIIQTSGNAPSYIYRLLGEYFHPEDVEMSIKD